MIIERVTAMFKFFKLYFFILVALFISTNAYSESPGTNKYAWLSSLKVVKFLPLLSADPFSGVIITDWYNIDPNNRYKLDVYVLSGILNANSVHVSVFKQTYKGGSWVFVQVSPEVSRKLEETILNNARILRSSTN